MPSVRLGPGPLDYVDTGGDGPVLVFVHGLMMTGSLWTGVVERLEPAFRCVVPTFPLGAHRAPMKPGTDLSPAGLARLMSAFLSALDLDDVTLVVCDMSYPQALADGRDRRIRRLVLTPCEAFDNMPPGLPGKTVGLAARMPGGIWAAAHLLRVPGAQRLPMTFGRMSARPIPKALLAEWTREARRNAGARRDLRSYVGTANAEWQKDATAGLAGFRGPALILWDEHDRVMPFEHAVRLAGLIPQARLVVVQDSRTLMPLDAPEAVAEHIREFMSS